MSVAGQSGENPFSRTLLDTHPAATCCVARDGRLIYANRAAVTLFDLNPDDPDISVADTLGISIGTLEEISGSTQWQTFGAQIARGPHKGVRMALQGRGLREADGTLFCMIVPDEMQIRQFREHTRLVARLNAELKEQQKLRDALDVALANEKHLHAELIHRVKNNLAILAALIGSKAAAADDPAVMEALEDLQLRTRAIALAHDLLDRRRQIDIIDAEELLDELCDLMESALCPPGVHIKRELIPFRLHISDATPLCLVVNELVTNSLKHAFKERDGGIVTVALKRNGVDKLEVSIADDGPGIVLLEAARRTTHGASVVEALTEQLGGELHVNQGEGTARWTLVFPPRSLETAAA